MLFICIIQDKVIVDVIFNEKWGTQDGFIYARDYNNFNDDNEELLNEYIFIPNKKYQIITLEKK